LAAHFLRRFGRDLGKQMDRIAPESLKVLTSYSWPGNVRELQGVLKKAILQGTGPVLLPEFLPELIKPDSPASIPTAPTGDKAGFPDLAAYIQRRLQDGTNDLYAEIQSVIDRLLLLEVLRHTGNNLTQAARILGISRATLRNRLAVLGITVERSTTVEGEEAEEA
jgi:two-component system nitrogen regulation response regulator GlnG